MVKQRHILFISSWYPNRNHSTHGIFNRYFAEAASLHNKISVLHVCSDEHLEQGFEIVEANENNIYTCIVYYKKIKSTLPVFSQLKKSKALLKCFDKGFNTLIKKVGQPDLIQLNVVMPAGIGVIHLSQKHNIPFIINEGWSGYTKEDGNYKGSLLKYFTKKIVQKSRLVMPTSNYLKEAMLLHGLKANYKVVPNVVNTHLFKPNENYQPGKITQFIHVSSLVEREKNVSGIIRSFAKALQKNKDLYLNIIGEGENRKELQLLAENLGAATQINFNGSLKPADLAKEMANSEALLMFSNYETFSLVIIESFSCGNPVITSNVRGINDYMRPEFGLVVNKNDEAQLCEAILEFAAQKTRYNKALIREFAVNNYSYETIGKTLQEIYENVLSINASKNDFVRNANITAS